MRMIRPRLKAPQTVVAEEQEEFSPVTVAYVRNDQYGAPGTEHGPLNTAVMAFRPSEEERKKIAEGADIYIGLLTFMKPQQGIIVQVGPEAIAEWALVGPADNQQLVEVEAP